MASYTTLKYGSKGDEVKKMQQGLIDAGYDLGSSGADGVYGSRTQAAVRQYQQDNGLGVDGIAGASTLDKLYAPAATTGEALQPTKSAADMLAEYEQNKPGAYVSPYAEQLQQHLQNKPAEYQSPWTEQLNNLYEQIVNREAFSYDFTADPMYQHYADQYQQKGQQAMRDTMGQAAALTGGYGSSYGQMVGQQTYDNYLQGLNDVLPQLRDAAFQRYQNEAARDMEALSLMQGMEDAEYGRYRDQLADYYNAADLLLGQDADAYARYRDSIGDYYTERDYWYGKAADEAAMALAAQRGGGGGDGGDDDTGDSLPAPDPEYEQYMGKGYIELDQILDTYTRVGIPNTGIDAIVNAALYSGSISETQAGVLRSKYKNRDMNGVDPYQGSDYNSRRLSGTYVPQRPDKPSKLTR